jgi:hypothetical protein
MSTCRSRGGGFDGERVHAVVKIPSRRSVVRTNRQSRLVAEISRTTEIDLGPPRRQAAFGTPQVSPRDERSVADLVEEQRAPRWRAFETPRLAIVRALGGRFFVAEISDPNSVG